MRISFGGSITVPAQAERWYSELRAGRSFGATTNLLAVAAANGHIQLFNPVASGRIIEIYRIVANTGAISSVQLRQHNTALATMVGNGVNLLSGGAASVGELRTATNAGLLGTLVYDKATLASEAIELTVLWTGEIGANQGYLIADPTVNEAIRGAWLWNEFVA